MASSGGAQLSLGKRLRSCLQFDDLKQELLSMPPAVPSATPISLSKTLPVFVASRTAQSPSIKMAGPVPRAASVGRFFSLPALIEAATTP